MASAWRIVLASEAAGAFSGHGSWRYGARWNSAGLRVIYSSENQATAAFEVFIHNRPFPSKRKFKAFHLEWPDELTEMFPAEELPSDWMALPASQSTREIGDAWVSEGRSAVLAVPSVIVPAERNFLLNPAHRDFRRIKVHPPVPFNFDPRLVGR